MTIFESICAIWKDDAAMMAALDVARFESGRVEDKLEGSDEDLNLPFALMDLVIEDEVEGSSHGEFDEEIFEVHFFFEKAYDARRARAEFRRMIRAANREGKLIHDEGRLISMNKRSGNRKVETGRICRAFDEWSVLTNK